jgi:hypothetical protein
MYHSRSNLWPHLHHSTRHHLLSKLHGYAWHPWYPRAGHYWVRSSWNLIDSSYHGGWLASLSAYLIIVIFDKVLNVVELSIGECLSCSWVHKRDLINEVFSHVLIAVLNEDVSRDFLLYIEI